MPNFTSEELRVILANKAGIFSVTQNQLVDIETMLISEAVRTRTSFDAHLLNILDVETSIVQWQNQGNNNNKLTHLGIFYGLETTGSERKMNLSMWAVRLDNSPNANLRERPMRVSTHVSTGNNALLTTNNGVKVRHNGMRRHFKETFTLLYDNRKIIFGAYMRLEKVIEALDSFQNCDKLRITFGFMKQQSVDDANCFHLIFRGINSSTNTLSNTIFSTFDGEVGYSGPKPSCPPFGEPED